MGLKSPGRKFSRGVKDFTQLNAVHNDQLSTKVFGNSILKAGCKLDISNRYDGLMTISCVFINKSLSTKFSDFHKLT
jgi:hypothetical protein